jgi:hypothetical protein
MVHAKGFKDSKDEGKSSLIGPDCLPGGGCNSTVLSSLECKLTRAIHQARWRQDTEKVEQDEDLLGDDLLEQPGESGALGARPIRRSTEGAVPLT